MHFHAYLWVGDKEVFDQEWLRRPSAEGFRDSPLPPLRTTHWLLKSPRLIQGTWEDPQQAVGWLARRLEEYAPRLAGEHHADTVRLANLLTSAGERLAWGGDVGFGAYLGRPAFLSIAIVACSPNRAEPGIACPLAGGPAGR